MQKNCSASLISERKHTVGGTTFIVSSFTADNCTKTAEELIMDMLICAIKRKDVIS